MLDSGARRDDAVGMVIMGMVGMTEKSRVGGWRMAREAVGEERDNAAMHEGRVVVPHQQLFFERVGRPMFPGRRRGAGEFRFPRAGEGGRPAVVGVPGGVAAANSRPARDVGAGHVGVDCAGRGGGEDI